MENQPTRIGNLIPNREGRAPGSVNRTTKERTEAFREKLEKSNVMFLAVDELIRRLKEEPENIKTADLLKICSTYGPYMIQTVNMDEIAEQIAAISTREDAEKVASELAEKIKLLRVV